MLEGMRSPHRPDESRRQGLLGALAPVLEAQAASVDRPADFTVHDYAFHLTLASHDDNRVVEECCGRSGRACSASRISPSSPGRGPAALHREHVELTDAVARGDVTGFREMIDRHLRTRHDSYPVVAE